MMILANIRRVFNLLGKRRNLQEFDNRICSFFGYFSFPSMKLKLFP